uniref:Prolactin releasing hormone n=1 Tax=Labrus bergylta TaxID=56723 RepID=A0A3Q3GZV2_9LABR
AAMRLCAVFCVVLLFLTQALSGSHHEASISIRNPDIDASWYTGRGIRPVGRFGRKVAERKNQHLMVSCFCTCTETCRSSARSPCCLPATLL